MIRDLIRHFFRKVVSVAALALGICVSASAATAQDKPATEGSPQRPQSQLKIVPLRYADANNAAVMIQRLVEPQGIRIAAEARTNSLLIFAPETEIESVLRMVKLLDVEAKDAQRTSLKVFSLRNIEPDQFLENALQLATKGAAQFAIDRKRKQVILSADDLTAQTVEALLVRLDDQAARPNTPTLNAQVRVVWLATGLPDGTGTSVPDDMKEVVASLSRLGIEKPRVAAQTVVNVVLDQQFQANGLAKLDVPCQLMVSGVASEGKGTALLQINIRANRPVGKGTEELCNLQTTINAPPRHFVALGVTPTGTMTSVFVVQVLGEDVKSPKQK